MNLNIETKIKLDKFVPRPYQRQICDAFENKKFKKLICVMPRRCLSGNTHITMSDGSWKFLKDIVPGDKVLSWNGTSFIADTVKHHWSTGIKKTKSVRSGSYLPIVTSDNHVFASTTSDRSDVKWIEISKTNKHRSLLQYAGISDGLLHDLKVAEFLGFMLSDGYCSGDQQAKFTNINSDILDRVEYLTNELFDIKIIRIPNGNGFDLRFSNGTSGGGAFKNPVKEFFRLHNINMQKSIRRLPNIIWNFDEQSILYFFSSLISGDGNIFTHVEGFTAKDTGHKITPGIEITLNCGLSYLYAWDIYWLLRKIGIVSQVPYLEKKSNWKIKIGKGLGVRKLLSETCIYGKVDAQKKALEAAKFIKKSTNIVNGCFRSGFKINDLDEEELYDIETENYHNFVANGYLVHNSGKDIVAWNLMIRAAIRRVGLYVYALPSAVQARRVLFDGITLSGQKFLDFIPSELISSINIQQMKVTLINNSTIIFTGSENYDALRGTNPLGVVISEAAYTHPQFYPTIRPALLASDGFVILISTPFGENHFYTLYQIAKDNPTDWYSCFMTIQDTNHVSAEEIEREIESGEISPDMAEQEYRCSFGIGAIGAYYATYLNRMELNNQIGLVDWEPNYPVHSAWDIGVRDSTAILMFQVIGRQVNIIDMYQKSDVGLEHYINVLQNKPYIWGKHIAPHDIAVREFTSGGLSRFEKAAQLGIKFIIAPNISIMDGIESVRTTLPRVYVDNNRCKTLVSSLRNYRKQYDTATKTYKPQPLHDENSHICDALRYLCLTLPKIQNVSDPEALERRYNEAVYGNADLSKSNFFNDPVDRY